MTRMANDSERAVREILTDITMNDGCLQHPSDAPLDATGIDSVGMIELVYALENRFAIEIGDDEVAPENFTSIESLTALVARKCP
jgi:acyl carrier protein